MINFSSGPVPGKEIGAQKGMWFISLGTNSYPFCDCGFESNSEIMKEKESLNSVFLRKNWF